MGDFLQKVAKRKVKIKFRCGRFDRRVWWVSMVCTAALAGVCAWLFASAEGAYYLAAWTTMTMTLIVTLCLLSVPRRIILSEEELEIRCVMDTTYIPLRKIVDVEVVEDNGLRGRIPVVGTYGFWGYYGRYFDLRRRGFCRVYARRRSGCVAIHTSRRRYVVSCRTPEMLRSMILDAKSRSSRER